MGFVASESLARSAGDARIRPNPEATASVSLSINSSGPGPLVTERRWSALRSGTR
jgi:hypothetical protein